MVFLFLADGFEEIEALTPADVLRRAGIDVRTVSIGTDDMVSGSHGIQVKADCLIEDVLGLIEDEAEMLILPGGMPGSKNLDENVHIDRLIKSAFEKGTPIAAICAAPMIPGKRGMLAGKRAACYPGFEKYLEGAVISGGRVEEDGNMITACAMGAAMEFALTLCRRLKGEDEAEKIASSVLER